MGVCPLSLVFYVRKMSSLTYNLLHSTLPPSALIKLHVVNYHFFIR